MGTAPPPSSRKSNRQGLLLETARASTHLHCMTRTPHAQQHRRFYRQIDYLERRLPVSRRTLDVVIARRFALIRVPTAALFMLGGLVGFLPVLGFWMLPLGLLLLAVDLPLLRAPVGGLIVRGRAFLRRHRAQRSVT
jgi:hypothetical protein